MPKGGMACTQNNTTTEPFSRPMLGCLRSAALTWHPRQATSCCPPLCLRPCSWCVRCPAALQPRMLCMHVHAVLVPVFCACVRGAATDVRGPCACACSVMAHSCVGCWIRSLLITHVRHAGGCIERGLHAVSSGCSTGGAPGRAPEAAAHACRVAQVGGVKGLGWDGQVGKEAKARSVWQLLTVCRLGGWWG